MIGQNDWPDESLTGQADDQAGHCPLTGRYFEPCKCFFCFCQTNFDFTGNEFVSMGWWNLRLTVSILAFYGQQSLFLPVMLTDT